MWPSSAGKKTSNKISSSTSKSKSSTTNTCLCPQTHLTRKSMEEIWKGINLSSLHNNQHPTALHQNFSSPLPHPTKQQQKKGPPPPPYSSARCGGVSRLNNNNNNNNNSPPAGDDDGVGVDSEGSDPVRSDPVVQSENQAANGGPDPSFLSSLNSPFDALSPSADPFPSFCKKRAVSETNNDDSSGNCRHKRMIKNRESAARSRARKQAYANGLETEVTRLLEENARLRRQVERYRAAAAAQLPKKQTLSRTLTAPF